MAPIPIYSLYRESLPFRATRGAILRLACRDYDGFPGRPTGAPEGGRGPEGGDAGGEVVAIGTPEEKRPALGLDPRVAANPASYTGHYLKQVLERRPSSKAKRAAEMQAAE